MMFYISPLNDLMYAIIDKKTYVKRDESLYTGWCLAHASADRILLLPGLPDTYLMMTRQTL
jgi:hypothetical protein